MPVIVVGADTEFGRAIVARLSGRDGEVRAFVTNPSAVQELRDLGIKVAVGDVSDGSHVGGAALQAFSAVLVAEAATDGRERAFAPTPEAVLAAWLEGIADAGVRRVIWVGAGEMPASVAECGLERAAIDTDAHSPEEAAAEVFRLDDLASLS